MAGKSLWGSIAGFVLLVAPHTEPFLPKSVFEVVGFAALPGEFSQWELAVTWSLPHLFLWLPVVAGLGLIMWANWGFIEMKIKNPTIRVVTVSCLLLGSFFVPSFAPESQAQQTGPASQPAAMPPSSPQTSTPGVTSQGTVGTATGQGSAGVNNGSITNNTSSQQTVNQSSTGNCSPNIVGSNNTNDCSQPPVIAASNQVSVQTNNPALPWRTTFSISSDQPVEAGDIVLTCSEPCLMVGISRINPYAFSSGENGPLPNEPDTVRYQLAPEPLAANQNVTVAVYSKDPITVLSGTIGGYKITFPPSQ